MKRLIYDHIIEVTKEKNRTYISIDFAPRVEVKNGDSFGLSRVVEISRRELFFGVIYGKFLEIKHTWRKKYEQIPT